MEWLKTILPIIGVLVGWLLSESGKVFNEKRQDKRKLKKLLFLLMDLRYRFTKELSYELYLDGYITIIKSKLADKFGVEKNATELDNLKPLLQNLISKVKQPDQFDFLTENIDKILIELAEVFPILAYELSGQHSIKDRLNKANNYFSEFEALSTEMPFDIRELVNPKLTKELLKDLDGSIEKIARKIDKETLHNSKEKILKMDVVEDDGKTEKMIDQYLNEVAELMK